MLGDGNAETRGKAEVIEHLATRLCDPPVATKRGQQPVGTGQPAVVAQQGGEITRLYPGKRSGEQRAPLGVHRGALQQAIDVVHRPVSSRWGDMREIMWPAPLPVQ